MRQDGLEMVLLRNAFYRDNYRRAVIIFLLVLAVNIVLLGTIFYKVSTPPAPQYPP